MDFSAENSRYTGPKKRSFFYRNEFLVVCPKCQKDALVTNYDARFRCGGELYCGNCHHAENIASRVRFTQLVNMNCTNCGRPIAVTIPNNKQKATSLLISCPYCKTPYKVKPRHEEYVSKYESASAVNDPVFNLPLWLQHSLKNDVFWAHNRTHLVDIKVYIQATLRERQLHSYTKMVERLPTFIKVAKNREAILKIINQLEHKSVASY
ncbi:hypothetical protein QMK33_15910 [Hymenobacter sp. H14-R3]|uniref:hypothetical protein n=1 Tax=Hymenobacter sp. H14-R3 TaxID=3046308 RepID=UPI0024BA9305|nr:hypothetical protein [Hymenobacter sp. H14-R3]MDJ0366643.1 hypothetical protein [Hymenobacter sp. H14-R3]